jgi:hypothetical protein
MFVNSCGLLELKLIVIDPFSAAAEESFMGPTLGYNNTDYK